MGKNAFQHVAEVVKPAALATGYAQVEAAFQMAVAGGSLKKAPKLPPRDAAEAPQVAPNAVRQDVLRLLSEVTGQGAEEHRQQLAQADCPPRCSLGKL